jgi:hypothetical protein
LVMRGKVTMHMSKIAERGGSRGDMLASMINSLPIYDATGKVERERVRSVG